MKTNSAHLFKMNQAQATFDNKFFREIKPLLKIFTVGTIITPLVPKHNLSSILSKSKSYKIEKLNKK